SSRTSRRSSAGDECGATLGPVIAQTAGRGTPLVLIHGFAVDHRILLPLEDMIGERPWRRVYLDLPWAEGAVDTGVATPRELADAVLDE
ncbi:hypothetical protein ACT3J6_22650, partial [Mycobacterium tuberculosis]